MGNLVNLRHLLISGGIYGVRSLPKGVGRLTSLRTLPAFIVCDEDASDEVQVMCAK